MYESLRIFRLLLYKSWLIRKKRLIITLLAEMLGPVVGTIYIMYTTSTKSSRPPEVSTMDHYYVKESLNHLLEFVHPSIPAYYAPKNTFTSELMTNVQRCFKNRLNPVEGFATESEFDAFRRKQTSFNGTAPVVIFDEPIDQSAKHLSYKLRHLGKAKPLYNSEATTRIHSELYQHYVMKSNLAQMQICLDSSFVNMKSGNKPIPDIYVQRVPYPVQTKPIPIPFGEERRMWYVFSLLFSFLAPFASETARAASEKFSGVNVLMSMNGISNSLNLLSWITSGIVFWGGVYVIPILILLIHTSGDTLSFIHYGNPLLLFFVLIFYLTHLLTFGIHVSAYFTRALILTIILIIVHIPMMALHLVIFTDQTRYLVPYLGIVFPNILVHQAIDEINAYETKTEGIQWSNLFTNAHPNSGIGGSVGVTLILFVIGTIFHFLLAIYIYAIKPGKYGVAKHPLYFLKVKPKSIANNQQTVENIEYDEIYDQYFEPVPKDVYTRGIHIRNLKKDYNIDLFTKEKVHALQGVSVDFYKGQMTALLGHNGAGKTTLISILTGMTKPTEGTVLIDSKDLGENASEIVQDMGLCTQENMYFSSLTVSDQLLFFTMVKRKDKSKSSARADVTSLLEKLKLDEKKDAMPDTLSGGQKRRLCLGMALVGDASTLILDEPTSGLDPESRRVIWNILLKMRGQKTILISTHDMEEAEILGDRIVIMHAGQVKSYGTSLFLKRLIGQNDVEITLSIDPRSDPEKIRSELHEDGIIVDRGPSKMIVKIPHSPELPDTLDTLEQKKEALGVSGFSVSLISLEQVFLKMTEETGVLAIPQESVDSEDEKLTGRALYVQSVRALLSKKLSYTLKDYSTILVKVCAALMALTVNAIIFEVFEARLHIKEELIPVNLKMYNKPDVLYSSDDKTLGDRYKSVSQSLGGNSILVSNTDLENALMQRAKEDLVSYNNYLIAAAEFDKSNATAFYSETATFSLPISINLLSNTILKNFVGPDYSISLSSQPMSPEVYLYADLSPLYGIQNIFMLMFYVTVAMYVVHPKRENARGLKHLQRMAGVSGRTYWGTMFMFDLIEYALFASFVIIGFLFIDLSLGLQLFGFTEIAMEILLFMLFGINTLPFMYLFSFSDKKTSQVIESVITKPAAMMAIETFMQNQASRSDGMKILRWIQKYTSLLLPCVSFLQAQQAFFVTAAANARCHKLPNDFYDSWCKVRGFSDVCCDLDCYDGKCKKSKPFFVQNDDDVNLRTSVIYLCATIIFYFVILAFKENPLDQKKASKQMEDDTEESSPDEQVQQEKEMVLERIQMLSGNNPNSIIDGRTSNEQDSSLDNPVFLVYELQKSYKDIRAVKDISFGVNPHECFGLLGNNGAGKTTAFSMMTGKELSDHGIMYIRDKDFENNKAYCLSQIGYCPQQDSILRFLNSYDHLRLFAKLRGVSEGRIENEVEAWIEKLNLNACALRPSGTYSGGNKRRLNIGIALIGSPNLILMDEPTTGVDPGARRSLWNVIKACQTAGQSIVLTSHSMVECEALCDRLAIMVDGKLVCIGASEQLKQRFGAGYDIQIKMDPEKAADQVDDIKNDMTQSLSCDLTDENLSYLKYHVASADTTWRKMFDVMNGIQKKYDCIEDFSVLSSSLEKLFMLFARSASSDSTDTN